MLDANRLAQSLGSNGNLALPQRPRLVADLVPLRESARCLILLGGSVPRLLAGRSVAAIAERLLPLLDGRRSIEQICSEARGFSPATALDALYFLYSEGVLVEGCAATPTPRSAFFDRYCAIRRNRANGHAAETALLNCRIGLLGDSEQFGATQTVLQQAGCAPAQVLAGIEDCTAGAFDLILLAGTPRDAAWTAALAQQLQTQRLPLLCLDTQALALGPLLTSLSLACLVCSQAQLPAPGSDAPTALEREHALALLSCRLISHIADLSDNALEQARVNFDPATFALQSTPVHRLVDCAHCGSRARTQTAVDTGFARCASLQQLVPYFHYNSQARASELARSSHLLSYSSGIRKTVAGAYKEYSRSEIQPLPAESASLAGRAAHIANALLGWNAQLYDGVQLMRARATPSAGNLASQNLYLVCDDDSGIATGVYYCHPGGGLRRICAGAHAAEIAAACPGAELCDRPQVWLIATASLARLEAKYREKAYRFAFHDAGALAEGLRAMGAAQGLQLQLGANFFDDRIAATLRLGSVAEIVTFAACLATPPETRLAAEAA